ncbi:hypothetical protein XENOCAPTIV_002551 [Xenoophorus captivus]|uniref:Uncharacterized protein n=2 Tax=Goodeidae TaxID=28758 RepID=A0ABV0S1T9_9TELE
MLLSVLMQQFIKRHMHTNTENDKYECVSLYMIINACNVLLSSKQVHDLCARVEKFNLTLELYVRYCGKGGHAQDAKMHDLISEEIRSIFMLRVFDAGCLCFQLL